MSTPPNPPADKTPPEWQRIIELIQIAEQAISTMLTLLRTKR